MSEPIANQPRSGAARRIKLILLLLLVWLVTLTLVFNFRLNKVEVVLANPALTKPVGQTWLLMGSDSRAGKKDPVLDGVPLGKFDGARADTIILLSVAGSLGGTSLTSLPRDLLVEIPAYGERDVRKNKINAAYAFGGPQLSILTVENFSQMQIEHFLEVGFVGLVKLVDAVGKIEVCPTQDFADEKSGLYINAGCQMIDGKTALAYARARYTDPRGDLGRVERQQEVIKAITKKSSSISTLLNPVAQFRIAWQLGDALTVDSKTNAWDMFLLGVSSLRGINSGTLPVESGGEIKDVGAVLVPVEPLASEILTAIKNGELPKYKD
jgi:LCP family protein required for cell wall assembly